MATYGWKCTDCGATWDVEVPMSQRNDSRVCPACGSDATRRVFEAPVLAWSPSSAEGGRSPYRERERTP